MIRVLLVDDHPVVRDGLRGMFASEPGVEVVGRRTTAWQRWRRRSSCGPMSS